MPSSQLILDYFKSIDFSIWNKKINFCMDQIIKLKTDDSRKKYHIELYATYLQLIEIFCRNSFAISEEKMDYLFAEVCKSITDKAEEQFKDLEFMNFILDNYIFGLVNKSSINNYEAKRALYERVLPESVVKDYCKHFQFINAYKHGSRVYGSGSKSLFFKKEGSEEKVLLKEFNSHVCCFYSEGKKDEKQLYKMEIFFNWQNVGMKSLMLASALENIQKVYLGQGTGLSLAHYFVTDHEMYIRNSGRGTRIVPINDIK